MRIDSTALTTGQPIPVRFALGKPDPTRHVTFSDNLNPPLAWADLPAGTRSLALIVHDPDVPSRGDDVNQVGRVVPAELPRVDFFHCVLLDLLPDGPAIAEGELSRGVTAHGKGREAAAPRGRAGINDYTAWFAGDADMKGDYLGYDGPCPPWNDSLVHHYHFTLYALDFARAPIEGRFDGRAARAAIAPHVLASAELVVTYAINPEARPRQR